MAESDKPPVLTLPLTCLSVSWTRAYSPITPCSKSRPRINVHFRDTFGTISVGPFFLHLPVALNQPTPSYRSITKLPTASRFTVPQSRLPSRDRPRDPRRPR